MSQGPTEARTADRCGLMNGCSDDKRWHCQAYQKDEPKADMKSADLKAFNPDKFEKHEDT